MSNENVHPEALELTDGDLDAVAGGDAYDEMVRALSEYQGNGSGGIQD